MPAGKMQIRVRSRDGLERVALEDANPTVGRLQQAIEEQLAVPVAGQRVSQRQGLLLAKGGAEATAGQFDDMANPGATLASLGIGNGSVVFLAHSSAERVVAGPPVTPAGTFGKKMTMDDLIARQMRIERQERPQCSSLSVDRDTANEFQSYVHESLAFSVKRGGFMYGTIAEGGEVAVEFIYEPPQDGSEEALLLLRDPEEERRVDTIAMGLGIRRVGFIFAQTVGQNKMDYILSAAEVRQAAALHAESGSPQWVTAVVKLTLSEDGGAVVHFEAFQLSDQCVKLWKEGWFVEDPPPGLDPKVSRMTKDVVILGKDSRDVDNAFFLVPVKILDHQGTLSSSFPIENRDPPPTLQSLKPHLEKNKNFPYVKRISDFHLLLLLSNYFDANTDVPQLAEAVRLQTPISDGYQLIIESLANNF